MSQVIRVNNDRRAFGLLLFFFGTRPVVCVKLTRLVRPGLVGHLQHQQLAALEALPDGVDAGDGGALQPHRHQRLPQLLVAVVLEGDLAIRAGCADQGDHGGAE